MTEPPVFKEQTQTIAKSVWLLAVARISMALSVPTLTVVIWLSSEWLDHKFDVVNHQFAIQDAKIDAQGTSNTNKNDIAITRIETVERSAAARIETAEKTASIAVTQSAAVNERLIAVETKQVEDRESAERFQAATLQRLDRLQDSIVSMSNAVSALTATLQANERKRP